MKSNAALRVVENNSHSSTNFTIKASGKMFHMVISGLYSDKPQSITREIWSNAFDAHAMVGKEHVPFEVTFPTQLSPVFSCRDFGPGIAHEDMEGFYTVLGHSTKEDTNAAVGKWGVGRMSPMSYTDTFSVTSRHKGMIAYYSIQLGPSGEPGLHVLAPPSPTDEPDGLEVSFPVKTKDIQAFQNAAELVSYGFDVKPTLKNSKDKVFEGIKKEFEGNGFYLYKDSRLSGAFAQMGCVLYPIPREYLPRPADIVYKFDIGDLEVTASREALSFGPSDPTEKSIRDKAKAVEGELFELLQKKVNEEPALFLGSRLARKLSRYLPYNKSNNLTYRGAPITRYWHLDMKEVSLHAGYRGYPSKTVGFGSNTKIDIQDDYTFYIQDLSSKEGSVRAATRIASKMGSYQHYIWVKAKLSDPAQAAEVKKLTSEFPYPIVYVKDTPDQGPTRVNSTRDISPSVWNPQSYRVKKSTISGTRFAEGGYYIPMSNNDFPTYIGLAMPLLLKELNTDAIPFVPKTLWKRFEKAGNWKPALDVVEKLVRKEAKEAHKVLSKNYNTYPMNKLAPFCSVKGPVGDFARKVTGTGCPKEYKSLSYPVWQRIIGRLGDTGLVFDNKEVVAEYETLMGKYPLLRAVATNRDLTLEHWEEYIKLKDKA